MCLQLHCLAATASLQMAMREVLMRWPPPPIHKRRSISTTPDDSVLDLDEEYPGLAEQVMQLQAAHQSAACAPPWQPFRFRLA